MPSPTSNTVRLTLAQSLYLSCLGAHGYEDQEPEYIAARWWHLLWLAIPIIGVLFFVGAVEAAYAD